MNIVIRAGGVGSRLWPVSREHHAKQFHALTSEKTMLQEAVDRVQPIAAMNDIFISTQAAGAALVQEQCPDIPVENIIVEPARKDTAAAIGLESIMIYKQNPEAIVASLGSDHSVRRVGEFQRMIQLAEEFVRRHPEYIIPIGIRPTQPDSGYGYIQYGEVLDTLEGKNLWKVKRFTEKPSVEEAKRFLQEENFLWNANMFVWKVSTILDLYKQHLPQMYEQLMQIHVALGTPQQQEVIERVYPTLQQIAVDYAIIEKTENIAAMSADIGWNDIGDWARLKDELADSELDNVVIGAEHLGIKTRNTLIYNNTDAKKMIVTIGVENMVIVETEDALLICDKYHSAEVKDVVQKLHDRKKDHLL
ncbi:MAG: mannose-1-phosphate guanylyltransferase [Candidatus Kerfeldbacteria bacterium]|nr:mannose-1-phosphate guanylyltransferase [Candidatus Kerfeldbacteria bacterium]